MSAVDVASAVDSIVRSIETAELAVSPWPHLVLSYVLPRGLYSELVSTPVGEAVDAGCRKISLLDREPRLKPWVLVRDAFCHDAVADAWRKAVGAKRRGYAAPRVNVDGPGYSLVPHPDVPTKVGVLAVSMPLRETPSLGLRVMEYADSRLEYTVQLPFVPNGGYAFARTEKSFHSVDLVGNQTRTSILVPFFVREGKPWAI